MGVADIIREPEIFTCKSCDRESKLYGRFQIRFFVCPFCGCGFHRVDGLFLKRQSELSIDNKFRIYLNLYDEAVIKGARYVLTGIIVRKEANAPYQWREYYLFNPARGYLVLSEYDGHWILLEQLKIFPHDPKKALSLLFQRRAYRLYNSYKTRIVSAEGEFCFDILEDTSDRIMEYVSPPYMISSERSSSEISWYAGEHLEPSMVKELFGKKDEPPKRIGIGAVQVQKTWVDIDTLKTLSVGFILFMLLTQVFMSWISDEAVIFDRTVNLDNVLQGGTSTGQPYQNSLSVNGSNSELQDSLMRSAGGTSGAVNKMFVSESFELISGGNNVELTTRSDLSNSWLELEIALVNESNGKVYNIDHAIEYYSGYDGGERWSEGSTDDNTLLSNLDPGKYHLEISNYHAEYGYPLTYQIKVTKDVPMWSNFFLVLILGLTIPVLIYWKHAQFEARRWENSNYG